jgi:hypothetical protein
MRRRKFVAGLLFSTVAWKRGIISHLIARATHTRVLVMLVFGNSWMNYAVIMSYSLTCKLLVFGNRNIL